MKIVILGSNGMLGFDLVKCFRSKEVQIHAFPKEKLNITSKEILFDKISRIRPDFIINAAAYTDVDGCEINKKKAMLVNATGVKYIALACKKYKCVPVHFSTDYIFDGEDKKGYKEDSVANPINFYGLTKLKSEENIQCICDKYYIIRTQWLYGHHGRNFVETIIRFSKEKEEIKVVNDQFGSPTYTKDLAKNVKILISKYKYGIYHITNGEICSWLDFANLIKKLIKSDVKITPTSSKNLNRLAKRPKFSILLNSKFKGEIRNWKAALREYIITR